MASARSKLPVALAAVLFLAAAASRQPGAYQLKAKVDACADQIIEHHKKTKEVFTPDCCKELARSQLGRACLVRKQVLTALPGVDIQKPFCVEGSGCTNY